MVYYVYSKYYYKTLNNFLERHNDCCEKKHDEKKQY